MFQHAPPITNCPYGSQEAPAVVALLESAVSRRTSGPVASPPGARRMSHDRKGPDVRARVALLSPGIDTRKIVVDAALLHEEGGYLGSFSGHEIPF